MEQPATKIVVLTIPRSGTHLVVRSIAKSLALPYYLPYSLGSTPLPTRYSEYVVGAHPFYNAPFVGLQDGKVVPEEGISSLHSTLLAEKGVTTLVVERNLLDNLLSYAAFDKVDVPINSSEFVASLQVKSFFFFYYNFNLWKKHFPVVNYDALTSKDAETRSKELALLTRLVGTPVELEEKEKTVKKALTPMGNGYTGFWKNVLSVDTLTKLQETYGVDIPITESIVSTPEEGDLLFLQAYETVLKDPNNKVTYTNWRIDEKLLEAKLLYKKD
jgi:hypothetical protein